MPLTGTRSPAAQSGAVTPNRPLLAPTRGKQLGGTSKRAHKSSDHASAPMSNSIVPWLGLWLIHYEGWRATGHWEGGGVPHGPGSPAETECRSN